MPAEVEQSPPLHSPVHSDVRPKGILKNPSFSGSSGQQPSPATEEPAPSASLYPQEAKDVTLQNTLQNAGPRRSSSAARRSSASRRQSAAISAAHNEDDPEKMRLKWDEANLYLAEQEAGGRMKITEPKTPYQYGDGGAMEEDEEDVAIDPRFVDVDEMDMANRKSEKKARESDIPGLDIGEPEDEFAAEPEFGDSRVLRNSSMSRESSKEKHVSVGDADMAAEQVGMPTREEQEKHRQFEEQRKRHYEMRDIKGLLGHPEDVDMEDDDESSSMAKKLPNRGVNGTR